MGAYDNQCFFLISTDTINVGNLLTPDRSKLFGPTTWGTGTETTFSLGYDYAPDGTKTASRVQIPPVVAAQMALRPSASVAVFGEEEPISYFAMKPSTTYTYSVWTKFLAPHNQGIGMQIHQYNADTGYINATSSNQFWDDYTALDTWTRASWSFTTFSNTDYAYWNLYTAWSPSTATDALFWGAKMEEGPVATGGPNVSLTNPSGTSVAWQTVNGDQYNRYKKIVVDFVTPPGCTNIGVYPLRDSGQADGDYADVLIWGASLRRVDGNPMFGGAIEGIDSYPLVGNAVDGNWYTGSYTSCSYSSSIAPDGTDMATRVYSTFNAHSITWNESTVSASVSYSFSFYARRNGQGVSASYSVYDWSNGGDIIAPTSYFNQLSPEPSLFSSAQARSIGPDLGGNTWFLQTNMTATYNAVAAPNGLTEATRYQWPDNGLTGPLEIAPRYNGDIYIPVVPGYNYCWSMWVKNNNTTGSWSSNFDIAFYDAGKNALESNWVHSKNMSGSLTGSNWCRVYVTGTAPPRTAYALCSALNGYNPSFIMDVYVWGAKLEVADIPTGDAASI